MEDCTGTKSVVLSNLTRNGNSEREDASETGCDDTRDGVGQYSFFDIEQRCLLEFGQGIRLEGETAARTILTLVRVFPKAQLLPAATNLSPLLVNPRLLLRCLLHQRVASNLEYLNAGRQKLYCASWHKGGMKA